MYARSSTEILYFVWIQPKHDPLLAIFVSDWLKIINKILKLQDLMICNLLVQQIKITRSSTMIPHFNLNCTKHILFKFSTLKLHVQMFYNLVPMVIVRFPYSSG
jgi:hypothetical protein